MEMEYNQQMKNRLRRIEGQIRGVLGMMEDQKECKDVVNQLSAIRAAVDRVILYVIGNNMEKCIRDEIDSGNGSEAVIQEAIDLLLKSR